MWPMANLRDCVSETAFGEPTVISGTGMQSITSSLSVSMIKFCGHCKCCVG